MENKSKSFRFYAIIFVIMKKLVILSFSVAFLALSVFIVNAATFEGPPSGCTSPEGTNCNLDGVIWNRSTADPAQNASYHISGNSRTDGSARIGNGLQVDAGNVNVANEVIANFNEGSSIIKLSNSGDLWMQSGKAIWVESVATSTIHIGNFGSGDDMIMNVYGTLRIEETGKNKTPQICLDGDCITAWPTTGGGGDITSVNAGIGITGGGASGDVTISVDEERYWNESGDIVNGTFQINSPVNNIGLGIQGSVGSGIGLLSVENTGSGYGGYFTGTQRGVAGYSDWNSASGWGGFFANNYGGSSRYAYLGGLSYSLYTTGNAYIAGSGNTICLGGSCRSAWPDSGTTLPSCGLNEVVKWNGSSWVCSIDQNSGGDITGVNAGIGMYVSSGAGPVPTLGLNLGYRLPQGCASGQVPVDDGSTWICGSAGSGDVTGVSAGGGVGVSNGAGPVPYVYLDTAWLNARYLNQTTSGETMNGYFTAVKGLISNDYGQIDGDLTVGGVTNAGTNSAGISMYVEGNEAIWHDGSRFSWGYGGNENYFADRLYINYTADAGLGTNSYYGGLTIGYIYGENMRIDGNEILAVNNGSASSLYLNRNGGTVYTGYSVVTSDRRFKNDITMLGYGIEDLMKLKPVSYKWKDSSDTNQHLGFIAQDVDEVIPEAVSMDPETGKYYMSYDSIVPILVKAVQEQQLQIKMLEKRLEALENK